MYMNEVNNLKREEMKGMFAIKVYSEGGDNLGVLIQAENIATVGASGLDYFSLLESWRRSHCGAARTPRAFVLYDRKSKNADRIINACVSYQWRFLCCGDFRSLRPMTLKDIAKSVGTDFSAVSRATSNVHIYTEYGTYSLDSYVADLEHPSLFDEGAIRFGREVSRLEVLSEIRDLFDAEDCTDPMTDQEVADILTREGYEISRRTVAKYRDEFLCIPKRSKRRVLRHLPLCA